MSTSGYDSTFSVGTTLVTVPLGATNGVLVNQQAGGLKTWLRMVSGGTCFIVGATFGQTLAAQDLASFTPFGWPLDLGSQDEIMLSGSARFYLAATGATSTVAILWEKSQNT